MNSIISDIVTKEDELKEAWHSAHALLTAPNDIRLLTDEENTVRNEIYDSRSKGQEFIIKNKPQTTVVTQQQTP